MHRNSFSIDIVIIALASSCFVIISFSSTQTRNEMVNRANFNAETRLYQKMVFKWDIQRVIAKGLKGECGVCDPVFAVCYHPLYIVLLCNILYFWTGWLCVS